MTTITIAIDARQAEQGAQQAARALDTVERSATKTADAVEDLQRRLDSQKIIAPSVSATIAPAIGATKAKAEELGRTLGGTGEKFVEMGRAGSAGADMASAGIARTLSSVRSMESAITFAARSAGVFGAAFFAGDLLSRMVTGQALTANINKGLKEFGTVALETIGIQGQQNSALDAQIAKLEQLEAALAAVRQEQGRAFREPRTAGGVFTGANLQDPDLQLKALQAIRQFEKDFGRQETSAGGLAPFAARLKAAGESDQEFMLRRRMAQAELAKFLQTLEAEQRAVDENAKSQAEWNKRLEEGAKLAAEFRNRDASRAGGGGPFGGLPGQAVNGLADGARWLALIAVETDKARKATAEFDKALAAGAEMKAREQGLQNIANVLTPMIQLMGAAGAQAALFAQQVEGSSAFFEGEVGASKGRAAIDDYLKGIDEQIVALKAFNKAGQDAYEFEIAAAELRRIASENNIENIDAEIGKLREKQALLSREQDLADENVKAAQRIARAWEEVGLAVGTAFERMIFDGASARDALRAMLEDISRILFRRMVTEQIASGIGGLFSAKGNAFMGGQVVPFAQGGIVTPSNWMGWQHGQSVHRFASGGVLSSPWMFPMAGDKVGVAGEAGPEAFMPLGRTKGGELGVKVADAPTKTVVINQRIYARDANSFRRSKRQIYDDAQFNMRG